ncbi:MAG: class II fumarate hydratase [Phycisphaerales bacterium]|nr:class II fumarate hydratase [Phycisphaerales bacterium]
MAKKSGRRRAAGARSRARTRHTRVESDSMGEMTLPADSIYGATTARAVANFPIANRPLPYEVIRAFVLLKCAAAETNMDLGVLQKTKARMIMKACNEIIDGIDAQAADGTLDAGWMKQFPVDVFQTGSGTSTNMNVNEVVSNHVSLSRGNEVGAKEPIHPNDHVNMGQSSNDTFPTAMQIAAAMAIKEHLLPSVKALAKALHAKARKWDKIVKIGRTHLMDATPVRLGQEFGGFAAQMDLARVRAERAMVRLAENLPIGGTAVGTGINTHSRFGKGVASRLSKMSGVKFSEAANHFEAQSTRDCVVEASGELKTIAVSLSKIASDIRLLGSGPRAGLFELSLPATQPGSSIMPGKVNPVMCESVVQVACQVIGNDAAITAGGLGGVGSILQLNVAMPMMAANIMESINLMANVANVFRERCIEGLEVNEENAAGFVERSLMLCTKLAPEIGYDTAARIAKESFAKNRTIREHVLALEMIEEELLDELLDAEGMTRPD